MEEEQQGQENILNHNSALCSSFRPFLISIFLLSTFRHLTFICGELENFYFEFPAYCNEYSLLDGQLLEGSEARNCLITEDLWRLVTSHLALEIFFLCQTSLSLGSRQRTGILSTALCWPLLDSTLCSVPFQR